MKQNSAPSPAPPDPPASASRPPAEGGADAASPEDPVSVARARLLRSLLLTGLILSSLYTLVALSAPRLGLRSDAPVYIRVLTFAGLYLLARSGRVKFTTQLTIAISLTLVSYTAWTNGGVRAPAIILYPALAASAGLLLSRRSSAVIGIFAVTISLAMVIAARRGLLPPPVRPATPVSTWVVLVLSMFGVSYLLRLSISVLEQALNRANREIAERKEIERELRQREAEISTMNSDLEQRVAARTAELIAAKEAAEAASRAKSTFLANMSHEIRTPLSGLLGTTELLRATSLDPDQRQLVEVTRLSGEALLSVINDVLDFSKIEAGKLDLLREPIPLRTTLEEAAVVLAERAQHKGLELALDVEDGLPQLDGVQLVVQGDRMRIRQVVTNLLGNAIKFTAEGEVRLVASVLEPPGERVRVRIEVQDTGIGIAPENLDRIFQPFVQADSSLNRRFGGTGLGLAICKRLVEAMGGEIGVTSTPGRGSCFWFTLELGVVRGSAAAAAVAANASRRSAVSLKRLKARGEATAPPILSAAAEPADKSPALESEPVPEPGAQVKADPEPAAPAPQRERERGRILLVEDNAINQLVARRVLQAHGFKVDVAADGRAGVDANANKRYDAILMDCQMPVLDGLEATRLIREREQAQGLPRVPILALTAHALSEERERCIAVGMDDYLSKPFAPQALIGMVVHWVEKAR